MYKGRIIFLINRLLIHRFRYVNDCIKDKSATKTHYTALCNISSASIWLILKEKIMKLALLISTAFVLVTAFKDSNCEAATAGTPLTGTKWVLKKIHSPARVEDISIKTAFIIFNAEKKSAGGKGGCNSFGGSFTVDKEKISIKNIFSTKMYCDGIQPVEDAFFKQLEKVTRFEIKEKILVLYQGNEALLELEAE